jgi:hypothetical protein
LISTLTGAVEQKILPVYAIHPQMLKVLRLQVNPTLNFWNATLHSVEKVAYA